MTHTSRSTWLAVGLLAVAGAAHAAPPASSNVDPLRLQYEREKADCTTGRSQQPRAACLREATAAYALARRGRLATPGEQPDELARNALKRCEAQSGEDRSLCERRVREGVAEGSVGGGGQMKTLTIRSTDIPKSPGN